MVNTLTLDNILANLYDLLYMDREHCHENITGCLYPIEHRHPGTGEWCFWRPSAADRRRHSSRHHRRRGLRGFGGTAAAAALARIFSAAARREGLCQLSREARAKAEG